MNINRHNYEEFFILYMDNELNPDERRMVEDFVQHHPDLKEELDMLLQYRLIPDPGVQYEGKEELMKENGLPPVTISNYEEWISLYIDNELSPAQKARFSEFMALHPELQNELLLFQQVKMNPESITFPYRDSLYRREEKVRSIPVRWWRAAAAILLLAAGLSFVFLFNKKPAGSGDLVKTNSGNKETPAGITNPVQPGENKTETLAAGTKENPVVNPLAEEKNMLQPTDKPASDKRSLAVSDKKTVPADNNIPVTGNGTLQKNEPIVAENNPRPSNNLPQPLNNPNTTISKPEEVVAYTPLPEKNELRNATASEIVTSPTAQPSNIVQASYKENEDALLDQADGKKNKNRGIFRKIARTFEKRTNIDPTDDENRLLVGGLAIRLK